ncbi:MAG: serine hydrolase [Fimbriimonadaceae bacterium]|nr:serine hydrolase [Fimbriimonadaceae bacterium]
MLATVAATVLFSNRTMNTLPSDLDQIAESAFASAQQKFPNDSLKVEDASISIFEINRSENSWVSGGFRGDQQMYPASVVKMFFLAYAAHLLDSGEITLSDEIQRAARDMIVDSNNDATGYMVDKICGTTPGPELSDEELKEFGEKRSAVNRWFESLNYPKINAVQRTYNEGPYGREAQWVGEKYTNRNSLCADACSRLMADIALNRHWNKERNEWMKSLLNRANPQDDFDKADDQARAYIGRVIPKGTKLYSKAGWVTKQRHDSAWLVMPDGREFAITIFTQKGSNMQLVSFIAAKILQSLGYDVKEPVGDPVEAPL